MTKLILPIIDSSKINIKIDYGQIISNKILIRTTILQISIALIISLISIKFEFIYIFYLIPLLVFISWWTHPYFRKKMPDWDISNYKIGSIALFENKIIIDNKKEFEINEIKKIEIKNGYYKGFSLTDEVDVAMPIQNGISEITIIMPQEEIYVYTYVIENLTNFMLYKMIIEKWYIHGVQIYEKGMHGNTRTFLFEGCDGIDIEKKIKKLRDKHPKLII